MSIFERLKGKDLLAQLKEHYPSKDVAPFGRVLMIPNRDFKGKWKDELESHGVKIYVSALNGQSIFLVKLEEADKPTAPDAEKGKALSSPTQEPEKKPDSSMVKPLVWTPEEERTLKTLHGQGLPAKEIAEKLGRSIFQVGAKIQHLPKRQSKHEEKADSEVKEAAAQTSLEDGIIKEFLASASILYPQYRRASAFLLKQAADKMEQAE
jgi:hypothetical protein